MIKNIIIKPRDFVVKLIQGKINISSEDPWALISIYSVDNDEIFNDDNLRGDLKERNCQDILSIRFGDITDTDYERILKYSNKIKREFHLFTEDQAHKIITFLDKIKNKVNFLLIHCDAGISRSGAVGIFSCRYYKLDENSFRKTNPYILPNQYVYMKLYEISGMKKEYEEWWNDEIPPDLKLIFT